MTLYYLNTNQQANGDYEVHTGSCTWLPAEGNREYLGQFSNCRDAVAEAKSRHPSWYRINGCKYCCPNCHTS
ncbi:hypothetical protein [Rhodobacter maris]|uniref:Uncharacterized protein n=1 Tax=Rhodobacter maris TaxID=446682 RepID=A0A285RJ03_9RHOB|nr:hypothetical protein [Rhodobacter maris]SOB94126.1 hypothetical protein SAMN05877831_101333 [Rhodobacter maris]